MVAGLWCGMKEIAKIVDQLASGIHHLPHLLNAYAIVVILCIAVLVALSIRSNYNEVSFSIALLRIFRMEFSANNGSERDAHDDK